jgi:flagellar biosynthesis chaperone FliJ
MNFNALAKVIGDRTVTGLVGFLYGDEGKIEIAEEMDKQDLLYAVNAEANSSARLQKATVLIGSLKAAREKLLKTASKAAQNEGADSPNVKNYANQIAQLDQSIVQLQSMLDELTKGHEAARTWVNRKQAQVTTNIVRDQLTLTRLEINDLLKDQIEFSQDMITTLPHSTPTNLRESVEKKAADEGAFSKAKIEVLNRLTEQQVNADGTDLDEGSQTAYDEILKQAGITPVEPEK